MRIHHDAAGNAVSRAEHHVGRFPRDARQRQHFVHGARYLPTEFVDNGFARAHDGFGFVAKEAGRPNLFLQFSGRGIGKIFGLRIFLVEFLGHLIHAHVGALCGKNRGNQELKRVVVRQFAASRGIGLIELRQDRRYALGVGPRCAHGRFLLRRSLCRLRFFRNFLSLAHFRFLFYRHCSSPFHPHSNILRDLPSVAYAFCAKGLHIPVLPNVEWRNSVSNTFLFEQNNCPASI